MTRNREIRLEDLTSCDHRPELPVSDNGVILYWLCRCGKEIPIPKPDAKTQSNSMGVEDDEADPMGG